MKRHGRVLVAVTVLGLAAVYLWKWEKKRPSPPYFTTISMDATSGKPKFAAIIEGHERTAELDLGFQGDAAITSALFEQLESKTFERKIVYSGVRNNPYSTDIFTIPSLQIAGVTFCKPKVEQRNDEFSKEAILIQDQEEKASRSEITFGWELFYHSNLLLDFQKGVLGFCDGIETLCKHGYARTSFVAVPLLMDHHLLKVELTGQDGPIRCLLDTGSTWNILNSREKGSLNEALLLEDTITLASLQLGDKPLPDIVFHPLPLHLPIQIDAVLGQEFLENCVVFIDFKKEQVYLAL